MTSAILLMLTCMAIGLGSTRLGKRSYIIMAIAIIAYVAYALRG